MKSLLNAPSASAPYTCRYVRLVIALFANVLLLSGSQRIVAAETLIPAGATWRYLDTGVDQGTAWRQTNFNDSAWAMGPAELGFGDGGETHVINGGPSNARYPTIYFRRTFVVTNRESLTNLALRLLRDDGGVVYLNGVEVFRSNLPEAPVTYGSWSAVSVAGSEESAFFGAAIPPTLLRSGTNVVAVEVHQADAGSSDLSFNFELLANTPLGHLPPVATVTIAPGIVVMGEVFTVSVTASDPETTVMRIDVMQDGATIRTFFASSGSFAWSSSVAGIHEFTARATDLTGMMGMSPPVRLLVTRPGFQPQSVFLPQFPSPSGLILQNAATVSSNVLHLHQATGGNRGAAWMATQQGIADGFISEFWFRITSKSGGGADGFAFIIAGTPQPNIGSGGLSYGGITNSLAVEFDTWMNSSDGDPDERHISVHSRGVLPNTLNESASIGTVTPAADFADNSGAVHKVRIEYVPGTLRVFLDNLFTPMLSLTVDLSTLLSLPTGKAWIGLAGGTGASWENHDIWTWSYISYANVPPTVSLTSPAKAIRVALGTDLSLTATANDPNGQVIAVYFLDGTTLIGVATNAPFSTVWSNPPAGIHFVRADAEDDGGADTFSTPVVVEVLSSNANVILFRDFSVPDDLILQGSAAFVADRLRLTPAVPSQIGGAWANGKIPVEHGFETVFQFQISQPSSSGGDGFAFVILNGNTPALGNAGASLGYSSVANSVAIEFDTYQNSEAVDSDANHIGVHSRGVAPNSTDESASFGRVTPSMDMSDGVIHTAVIRYSAGQLRIFLDELDLPVLKVPMDLATLLSLDNGTAWVGFTSATGGQFENHDILMWSFRPNVRPEVQLTPLTNGPFVVPTNIMISADVSDVDGEITRVEFFANSNSLGVVNTSPFAMSWSNAPAGTYSLNATAVDDFGTSTTSLPLTVSLVEPLRLKHHLRQIDGSITFDFTTISGQTYTIQYTADLIHWSNAVPSSITGTGSPAQWHDTGPPVTDSAPASQPQRFYRVIVSP